MIKQSLYVLIAQSLARVCPHLWKVEVTIPKKIDQKILVRLRKREKSCTFARIMRLKSNVNIKNRRATFDYEVLERYTAGIQLFGTEIKSIRESKASLVDTYCQFVGNELWVKQMHIAEYRFGSYANHEAKRDRKLLMTRKELRKLEKLVKDTGKTIIPLRLFINEKGFAKMEIALCQGKHTYDKRQALRAADDKRELQRAMKDFK